MISSKIRHQASNPSERHRYQQWPCLSMIKPSLKVKFSRRAKINSASRRDSDSSIKGMYITMDIRLDFHR